MKRLDMIPAPMPASEAVALDGPFVPRRSWWRRLFDYLVPVIPESHPDALGSLDAREFDGPLRHTNHENRSRNDE